MIASFTVQIIIFPPKRPVPPDPWNGVLDTLDIPPACPQPGEGVAYIEFHVPGFNSTSEDCLYLNIYTPKVSIQYQTSFLAKFRLLPDILPRDVILYEEYRYLFYKVRYKSLKKYVYVNAHLISSFKVNVLIMRNYHILILIVMKYVLNQDASFLLLY